VQHDDHQISGGRRALNGAIKLRVPIPTIKAKSAPYLKRGKPAQRPELLNESDYTIVASYGSVYRGIVQYYLLAGDVHRLHRLHWVMETSMLKTLAGKHRSTVSKMAAKHKAKIETPHGLRTCFEASIARDDRKPLVARFGGIPLKRQKAAALTDRAPTGATYPHKELIKRLLADICELCGQLDNMEVHHVRTLTELTKPGQLLPEWARLMTKRRRKTLVVCDACHGRIHPGQPAATLTQ